MSHPPPTPEAIAAIDLGSNSFHMVVASLAGGDLQIIDRLRDAVRLAAGLDGDNRLDADAQNRAFDCLRRFGERLHHMPSGAVRAVATSTLRVATNSDEFLASAEEALGHPIEVISGVEEARLIYQGVSHSLPGDGRQRLVIDIGGGSTEFVIGERHEPLHMESTAMGCVEMSQRHFPAGEITASGIRSARLAALMQIEPYQALYRDLGWDEVIGASGTIRAIHRVIRESGWGDDTITLPALGKLVEAMLKGGRVDKLKLPGLSERRQPVFAGGVMILLAAFEALGLEQMRVAEGALREGVLYDLLGRLRHEDVRVRAVAGLGSRFNVDSAQATRVEQTAVTLLSSVAGSWSMDADVAGQWLRWAAQLHEVGLGIAHSGYHKHGAYILENADLPGFSHQEQIMLATMVRSHRRKFPAALFKKLSRSQAAMAARLSVLLRIAATLHRSRSSNPLPQLEFRAGEGSLKLEFPDAWLDAHPLTRADLEQEADLMKPAGIRLEIG